MQQRKFKYFKNKLNKYTIKETKTKKLKKKQIIKIKKRHVEKSVYIQKKKKLLCEIGLGKLTMNNVVYHLDKFALVLFRYFFIFG